MRLRRSRIKGYEPRPRPARDWPVPLSCHRPVLRRTRELEPQAIALVSVRHPWDFLEVGNFAPFSEFLHIKGQNFPYVFYPFMSTYEPYEPLKVSWKSVRTFFRNFRKTNTQTDAAALYI